MKQLHERGCIEPIDPFTITKEEKKRAMESFIFMVEKKDGTIKSRTVANGSQQRSYTDKDATASPTTSIEAILIRLCTSGSYNFKRSGRPTIAFYFRNQNTTNIK